MNKKWMFYYFWEFSMSRPIGSGGKAKELNKQEIERISICLTGSTHELRNRALFYFCLASGVRVGEAVGLKIKDVKPNGKLLDQVVLEKHSCKSGKSRTIFISKQGLDHLKRYLDSRKTLSADDPLFPTQKKPHEPMGSNVAAQLMAKIFKRAGIENASSHSCRRSFANAMRRNSVDMEIIRQQLGHSSLSITSAYFNVDSIEAQRAVDNLRF